MKFSISSILILTPFLTLCVALAFPAVDDEIDSQCADKYCAIDYVNASYDCASSTGFDIVHSDEPNPPYWKEYLDCFCHGDAEVVYKQCLSCYKGGVAEEFTQGHDMICSGGVVDTNVGDSDKGDEDEVQTDNKENTENTGTGEKKNSAERLKSSTGLKMAGVMFLTGGVIGAAMF